MVNVFVRIGLRRKNDASTTNSYKNLQWILCRIFVCFFKTRFHRHFHKDLGQFEQLHIVLLKDLVMFFACYSIYMQTDGNVCLTFHVETTDVDTFVFDVIRNSLCKTKWDDKHQNLMSKCCEKQKKIIMAHQHLSKSRQWRRRKKSLMHQLLLAAALTTWKSSWYCSMSKKRKMWNARQTSKVLIDHLHLSFVFVSVCICNSQQCFVVVFQTSIFSASY